uniref:Uncharacterized protein n=1 Tax=Arcella intermedia TaxID=1963864 RepID=A0A6B2KYF9_9EUKA
MNHLSKFAPKNVENFFAFTYQFQLNLLKPILGNKFVFRDYGYVHFDYTNEFNRILRQEDSTANPNPWRIYKNQTYEVSPTYPANLYVPKNFNDDKIEKIVLSRTKKRLPVMSWVHPSTYAALLRSSQPKFRVGTSKEDKDYLESLSNYGTEGCLYIMDARPKVAAQANKAKGGGFEGADYQNVKIVFLGIENIHAVRTSWKTLISACHRKFSDEVNWHAKMAESGWLVHIYRILRGSIRVVKLLNDGYPVLVHCSDGWDRTSQIVSLSMLLNDPYYRTINGFQLLIEKEWLSFGHQFHLRQGHDGNSSEEAPIFLQFLECVSNFLKLFPWAFEFNEDFLVTIFDHSYSGAFGTFLLNNEKDRVSKRIWEKTPSLWLYMNENKHHYTNFYYKETKEVLVPHLRMCHISVWEKVFFRFDSAYMFSRFYYDRKFHSIQKETHPVPSPFSSIPPSVGSKMEASLSSSLDLSQSLPTSSDTISTSSTITSSTSSIPPTGITSSTPSIPPTGIATPPCDVVQEDSTLLQESLQKDPTDYSTPEKKPPIDKIKTPKVPLDRVRTTSSPVSPDPISPNSAKMDKTRSMDKKKPLLRSQPRNPQIVLRTQATAETLNMLKNISEFDSDSFAKIQSQIDEIQKSAKGKDAEANAYFRPPVRSRPTPRTTDTTTPLPPLSPTPNAPTTPPPTPDPEQRTSQPEVPPFNISSTNAQSQQPQSPQKTDTEEENDNPRIKKNRNAQAFEISALSKHIGLADDWEQ